MKLIADSGATKTDWCIGQSTSDCRIIHTQGINPFHQSKEHINKVLEGAQGATAGGELALPSRQEEQEGGGEGAEGHATAHKRERPQQRLLLRASLGRDRDLGGRSPPPPCADGTRPHPARPPLPEQHPLPHTHPQRTGLHTAGT